MTSYDSSGNVETMVEAISNFTIASSGGSITDATFLLFLANADTQVIADDPGFTQAQKNEACALLVCHYIARKKGQSGKTSLSIGKYSYSRTLKSGLTSWMDDYNALVESVKSAPYGVENLDTDGITRDDKTMTGLSLDQSVPYDLNDEDREDE